MKILVFTTNALSPFHYGTEVEIMENYMEQGHEIHVLKCNSTLQSCFFNPCHNLLACAICDGRTEHFVQQLGIKKVYTLQHFNEVDQQETPIFQDLNQLKDYKYRNVPIGRGVASSVISLERDYNLFDQERKGKMIKWQLRMAMNVVHNLEYLLDEVNPDKVLVFNGRHAEDFPLLLMCEERGIPYATHERGSSFQKYQIFENSLPHSLAGRQQIMFDMWDGENKEIVQKADHWFQVKRIGKNTDDKNYLVKQIQGSLPKNFNSSKRNFVLYNSSEDEMKAILEWDTQLFKHQNEAILNILEAFKDEPTFHFYLRMHPNLEGIDNQQTREIYSWNYPNFTLIRPEEKADTYAMIDACEKTICFGSTVGAEATYWGKPSLLIGKSFYDQLDCVYKPNSFEELFELIKTKDLAPKPRKECLPYGYFVSNFGETFKYLEYTDKTKTYYKGKRIRRIYSPTLWSLIKFLPKIPIWRKLNKVIFGRPLGWRDLFILKSHTVE